MSTGFRSVRDCLPKLQNLVVIQPLGYFLLLATVIGISCATVCAVGIFRFSASTNVLQYNDAVADWNRSYRKQFAEGNLKYAIQCQCELDDDYSGCGLHCGLSEGSGGHTSGKLDLSCQDYVPPHSTYPELADYVALCSVSDSIVPQLTNFELSRRLKVTLQLQNSDGTRVSEVGDLLVPLFRRVIPDHPTSKAACEELYGYWMHEVSNCLFIYSLQGLCVTVETSVSPGPWSIHHEDESHKDDECHCGCFPSTGDAQLETQVGPWSAATYVRRNATTFLLGVTPTPTPMPPTPPTPPYYLLPSTSPPDVGRLLAKAPGGKTPPKHFKHNSSYMVDLSEVRIMIRSSTDPHILAERITGGTMNWANVTLGGFILNGNLRGYVGHVLLMFSVVLTVMSLSACVIMAFSRRFRLKLFVTGAQSREQQQERYDLLTNIRAKTQYATVPHESFSRPNNFRV